MDQSSETLLRRALFEDTGGMYPELITRTDIKVFLPPIGNLTVYICEVFYIQFPQYLTLKSLVGNPSYLSDESKDLTLRVHDECMFPTQYPKFVQLKCLILFIAGNGSDRLWFRHLYLQAIPHIRHRRVYSWCSTRGCRRGRLLPQRKVARSVK